MATFCIGKGVQGDGLPLGSGSGGGGSEGEDTCSGALEPSPALQPHVSIA